MDGSEALLECNRLQVEGDKPGQVWEGLVSHLLVEEKLIWRDQIDEQEEVGEGELVSNHVVSKLEVVFEHLEVILESIQLHREGLLL